MRRLALTIVILWCVTSATVSWLLEPRVTSNHAIAQVASSSVLSGDMNGNSQLSEPSDTSESSSNGSPQATHVGRDVCRECHTDNHAWHTDHGHHKTFATTDDTNIIRLFEGRSYDSGDPYGTFTYHADDKGLFARIPEKFGDRQFRLPYALGSPEGAVPLLSLLPDAKQNTFAIEHRVSWFHDGEQLRPTPQEDD